MKVGDIDKICLRDYVVGLGWLLGSVCIGVLDIIFEQLPIAIQITHASGFGMGQKVILMLCLISSILALGYLIQTAEYQKYYGA